MNSSKLTFVFNNSIYAFIGIVLLGFYLGNNHFLIIVISLFYLVFLYRLSKITFLAIIILSIIYIIVYQSNYQKLIDKDELNKFKCIIYTIPKHEFNQYQFYCKSKNNKYLVYYTDKYQSNNLKIGYVIEMNNELELIKHNTVPNQFDYAKFLLADKIMYQNKVDDLKIINHKSSFQYQMINKIIDYYQNLKTKPYLLSFIIGNKDGFSDDFVDYTQMLNITHLFVVSGFHVGFLFIIFSFIFKYLNITKEKSEILVIFILLLFLYSNQFSVSVLRAVIFTILLLVNKKFSLKIANINILCIIGFINLLFNPFLLYHTGFILSYLITFVLLLSKDIFINKKNILMRLYQINLIAQLFSLPIVANFNFTYNFIAFLFTPFISLYYTVIIFPLTLILLVIKSLDEILYNVFQFYEQILEFLSSFSLFNINIGAFTTPRVIIYYLILFLIIKSIEIKKVNTILLIPFVFTIFFYHKFSLVDEVTFIDVGQGDSIFIRSDINKCKAIIDTGGNFYYHPGKNLKNYLQSIQTDEIDILFITHSDIDHAGDYGLILNSFKIKTIVFNFYNDDPLQKEIEEAARNKKINILKVKAYNKVECGNLVFNIINPFEKNNTINDNSLVLFLIFNNDNYLFSGDVNSSVLENIPELYKLNVDFLKISHHGSKFATSRNLLSQIDVKNAIISVGKNNYHHPADEVLELLNEQNINVYRTDYNGTISVKYYLKNKRIVNLHRPYNIST